MRDFGAWGWSSVIRHLSVACRGRSPRGQAERVAPDACAPSPGFPGTALGKKISLDKKGRGSDVPLQSVRAALRGRVRETTHRTQYMVVCLARPDGPSALGRASDVSSKIPEFRVGRVPLPPVRSLLLKVLTIVVNFFIFRCYHMITCFRSYI